MTDFDILNLPIWWRGLPHQRDALHFMWAQLSPSQQQEFVHRWRSPGRDSRIQKILGAVPADRRRNAEVAVPLLMKYCDKYQVQDLNQIAYIMATVSHESMFAPIAEMGSRPYFHRYEGRADLGNTQPGDGFLFRGRGYVQITGRRNYEVLGNLLDLGLVDNPDLALVPVHAAEICVLGMRDGRFTGRKLADFDRPGGEYDWFNARRIVNHVDRADLIASYGRHYRQALG